MRKFIFLVFYSFFFSCAVHSEVIFFQKRSIEDVFSSIKVYSGNFPTFLKFFWNAEDAWFAQWKMVAEAKSTIDCSFSPTSKSVFRNAFLGLIAQKARRGVKIRLIADLRGIPSVDASESLDLLRELGSIENVRIKLYDSPLQFLVRNIGKAEAFGIISGKITIVDGTLCLFGKGVVPAEVASATICRTPTIALYGKYVGNELQKAFEREWASLGNCLPPQKFQNPTNQSEKMDMARRVLEKFMSSQELANPGKTRLPDSMKKTLISLNKEICKFSKLVSFKDFQIGFGRKPVPFKIIDQGHPYREMCDGNQLFVNFLDNCREEIFVQSPFLFVTSASYEALKRASSRGVKIFFHLNSESGSESPFPLALMDYGWKKILKDLPTARILVSPPTEDRLHSTIVIFDSKVTALRVYSFDPFFPNGFSELVAFINDPSLSSELRSKLISHLDGVVEYKIQNDGHGKIVSISGPDEELFADIQHKIQLFNKIGFIRPLF